MPESNDYTEKKEFDIKSSSQRNRNIAAVALFAALATILHLSPIKIPAPYAPFLVYELWEIPIIVAFYLYGARVSVPVAVINFMSLLVMFPWKIPTGPLYNLIAILSMILGFLLVYRINGKISWLQSGVGLFLLTVIMGSSIRVLIMTVVNAAWLPMPPPLGFSLPFEVVIPLLPLIGFFNFSLTLYSILIARLIIKAISSRTSIPVKYSV